MSVSLSRSTSFCSHTSSPSCSPSPHRLQSPSSTTRRANIPRSTANSPLPYLATKSAYLQSGATAPDAKASFNSDRYDLPSTSTAPVSSSLRFSASSASSSSSTTSTTTMVATATPVRRGHRGSKDATRVIRKKYTMTPASSSSTRAPVEPTASTPLNNSAQVMESATWTRRRGLTAEAERLDSSSGSEQEEDVRRVERIAEGSTLSPAFKASERAQISDTIEARRASLNFASLLAEEEDGLPSPRRNISNKGMAALFFSAHGLERNFETKISMTPPARMSSTHNESPFTTSGLHAYPATEAKRVSIPRSNAFGPFAPLPTDGVPSPGWKAMRRNGGLLTRSALGIDGLPEYDEEDDSKSSSLMFLKGLAEVPKHSRARTEGAQKRSSKAVSPLKSVQEPRRRAATMLKAGNQRPYAMDMDDSEENDDVPPPSPSPAGEMCFPKRINFSEGESSTESDDEGIILRPGARIVPTRSGSSRSISTSQCHEYIPSMIGFGGEIPVRSLTTSALKNTHNSQTSFSTSHSSTRLSSHGSISQHNKSSSSSPYKTPNKRRARMPSLSSTGRNGTISAASPIATPIQSEEGSLFATPSREETESLSATHKRRSTGSFLPSTPAGTQPRAIEGSPVTSQTPISRSKRSSLPPTAPETLNQRRLALSKLDNSIASSNTPSSFDDSGVAFISPLGISSEKGQERALGRYLGMGSLTRTPGLSNQDSPSKEALTRRSASDSHSTIHHPFGVRERSALANETRLSDGNSSTSSSPEVVFRSARVGSASSVPEGLVSPARCIPNRRTSLSASALAVDDLQAPYLTPQNYKNVIPLQTAFMSTGLASKRSRPMMGTIDLATGEALPPLPPKPNFTLHNNGPSSIAPQVGLREVVAAANAHSAATNKPTIMPDTPMKKPVFPPFAGHVNKAKPIEVSKYKPCTTHRSVALPSMLSPPPKKHGDENETSSSGGSAYDGDSPLLNQDCDSPTLGLSAVSGKNAWTTCPQPSQTPCKLSGNMSVSPTHLPPRMGVAPNLTSPDILLCEDGKDIRIATDENVQINGNLSASGPPRPASLLGRSVLMQHRPSLGLQRKSSFGPNFEQGLSLSGSMANSPVLGSDFIPTTPTRNSTNIKWFEGTLPFFLVSEV